MLVCCTWLGGVGGEEAIQSNRREVGCVSIFLDGLSLVGVSNGVGFCVRGKFVRCNTILRQYLNTLSNMGIKNGLIIILGLIMVTCVGNMLGNGM